jgi:hypothetical protein
MGTLHVLLWFVAIAMSYSATVQLITWNSFRRRARAKGWDVPLFDAPMEGVDARVLALAVPAKEESLGHPEFDRMGTDRENLLAILRAQPLPPKRPPRCGC